MPIFENSPKKIPFALSLSKGSSAQEWFHRPVLSGAEGLTTNGSESAEFSKGVPAINPTHVTGECLL